jgi:ribosomal protein L7/L12
MKMKLDKIKFAKLIHHITQFGFNGDVEDIDDMIDINVPEAPKALTHEVDELLRCMLSANSDGFIPAIKAYRVLTNAGLKEAKEAIERYRSTPKLNAWTKKEMLIL